MYRGSKIRKLIKARKVRNTLTRRSHLPLDALAIPRPCQTRRAAEARAHVTATTGNYVIIVASAPTSSLLHMAAPFLRSMQCSSTVWVLVVSHHSQRVTSSIVFDTFVQPRCDSRLAQLQAFGYSFAAFPAASLLGMLCAIANSTVSFWGDDLLARTCRR